MCMFNEMGMLCQVENDGYAVQEGVLSEPEIAELINALEKQQNGDSLLRHGRIFAVRNLLDLPEIGKLSLLGTMKSVWTPVYLYTPAPTASKSLQKILATRREYRGHDPKWQEPARAAPYRLHF